MKLNNTLTLRTRRNELQHTAGLARRLTIRPDLRARLPQCDTGFQPVAPAAVPAAPTEVPENFAGAAWQRYLDRKASQQATASEVAKAVAEERQAFDSWLEKSERYPVPTWGQLAKSLRMMAFAIALGTGLAWTVCSILHSMIGK